MNIDLMAQPPIHFANRTIFIMSWLEHIFKITREETIREYLAKGQRENHRSVVTAAAGEDGSSCVFLTVGFGGGGGGVFFDGAESAILGLGANAGFGLAPPLHVVRFGCCCCDLRE